MRGTTGGSAHDPPDDRPDEDLVPLLRTDPAALAVFYRRHVDKVVGFAARRCTDPADVADVVAATFVAVIESCGRFDPARGRAVAWLLGVAHHTLLAQRRKQLGEARAWARLGGRRVCDPDDYDELVARMDAERSSSRLAHALPDLPENQRVVVDLVVRDGLTPQDAAAVLGISAASARVRLARGRRRLRRVLDEPAQPPASAPVRALPLDLPARTALQRSRP